LSNCQLFGILLPSDADLQNTSCTFFLQDKEDYKFQIKARIKIILLENLEEISKVKQSLYTPWRRFGGEEV
jgi:hypothetical protein